jgi:hypothetical protein
VGVPCDRCERNVGAKDFDPGSGLARCAHCDLVFELMFAPPPSLEPAVLERPIGRRRAKVPLPPGFSANLPEPEPVRVPLPLEDAAMVPYREAAIARMTDRVTVPRPNARARIRIRPRPVEDLGGILFMIAIFTGLACFFAYGMIAGPGPVTLARALGATALVGFAILLVWAMAARTLNRTTILLCDGELRIRHHPVPAFGGRRIPAAGIQQIWTRRVVVVGTTGRSGNRFEHVSFKVEAGLWNGESIVLLTGLELQEQALYIEQSLEHALGIIDVGGPGEMVERHG